MLANPTIFREYDIRGIADRDFDAQLAYKLGRAYARLAKSRLKISSPTIAIGRDCRLTGEKFLHALGLGLASEGAEVTDLGLITTPISYFSVYHRGFAGAVMVTGSHNPPEYNGFKMCLGKGTIYGKDIQELRESISSDLNAPAATAVSAAKFPKLNLVPDYLKFVHENVQVKPGIKVVVDSGNGAAGPVAPVLFRMLGCHVTELFCEPDGNFPNHEADPTVPKNLEDLIRAVRATKSDFGVAFDGDADRIGVVDENGKILWGDELLVIFAREILARRPGVTIISEVKSSSRLYNDIAAHGGKPIMWKTGHSLIKAKIKETNAALAGEMSGHVFFADRYFGYDDAIYAAARLLEIVSKTGAKVSSLTADLPPAFNTPEIRVDCADERKFSVVETIKKSFSGKYPTNEIDGVRVDFGDGWGLVRASNTQPVIVMRFEAVSETRLESIRQEVETAARKAGLEL